MEDKWLALAERIVTLTEKTLESRSKERAEQNARIEKILEVFVSQLSKLGSSPSPDPVEVPPS